MKGISLQHVAALVVLFGGLSIECCYAQPGSILRVFANPDYGPDANYGAEIDVAGNIIAIGAPGADIGDVQDAGAIDLYDRLTGALVGTIFNPDPAPFDYFGAHFTLSEDYLLSGTPFADVDGLTSAGRADLFDLGTGALSHTLANPGPSAFDIFGIAVAVEGTRVFVGAPRDDPAGLSNAGTTYQFDAITGTLVRTINHPDLPTGAQFGSALAVTANRTVISAPYDDTDDVPNGGSVMVFDPLGVPLTTIENPVTGEFERNFGISLDANDELIAVGAAYDSSTNGLGGGWVHVFDDDTLELVRTFGEPSAFDDIELFGWDVAITDELLLSGVPGQYPSGSSFYSAFGGAVLFDLETREQLFEILNPEPEQGEEFGWRVAFAGTDMLFGVPGDGNGAGAVYMVEGVAVPEPSSLILACVGLLAVVAVARRSCRCRSVRRA